MSEKYRPRLNLYNPTSEQIDDFHDTLRWKDSGRQLAEYLALQEHPIMLLDMDGVIMQGDSLAFPQLITPQIIPALAALEAQGVTLGPATARSEHVVHYLRGKGLRLEGPTILEEGHVFIHGERKEHIAIPGHKEFILAVKEALSDHPAHKDTWEEAQKSVTEENKFAFCHGNYQWQGECRASFWFSYKEDQKHDEQIVSDTFEPAFKQAAEKNGLDFERDIEVTVTRMRVNNLAIVSIKGKVFGNPVHKGIAVKHFLQTPWVFVADGFGDSTLSEITQKQNGFVIGIKGNLDISKEVPHFLRHANVTLNTPEEFVDSLYLASHLLQLR